MKILRIVYDWPPPWAGLAPHPYEVTLAQVKLGHQIEVICGRWPRAGAIEQPLGVKIHAFWREPIKDTIYLTTSVLAFFYYLRWRRGNRPDLIHSHGHLAIWIYLYRLILQRFFSKSEELTIPLVSHFHNTVEGRWRALEERESSIKPTSKFFGWPLARLSDRLAVKVSDALIFVSEETRQEAIKYYQANPEICFVVETGVNSDTFKPVDPDEKDKTRHDIGFDPQDKIIINHGLMVKRKNIHLLIEALQYLPIEYKLFLVGPFEDKSYKDEIDDLLFNKKLGDRVMISGYIPYPETPIAYQASDIFVLPSSWEGLPKVVMQSLACGIPALASAFKLGEELPGMFYLDELSPQHIAQKIKEIVGAKPFVDVYKVRKKYSWDTRVGLIEGVYEYVWRNRGKNRV